MWRIVSRASRDDSPKLWRDMTPEEKSAMLLARQEGKVIEWCAHPDTDWEITDIPIWIGNLAYRIRPGPKAETVTLRGV
jgi:hypothetical protein